MPHVVGIAEVKPKNNRYQILASEFALNGLNYNMISKNVEESEGRGLILYTDHRINAKEIKMETNFSECIFAECKLNNKDKLLIGLIYRSDSGSNENNDNLIKLTNEACEKGFSHILLMGDYNYPNIDWDAWHVNNLESQEAKFMNCLQDNYLYQHITKPTRTRGTDRANVLDLIISNDENITDLEYQSPLGKSDHSVLVFQYNCNVMLKDSVKEISMYNKANFKEMAKEMDNINWDEYLNTGCEDMSPQEAMNNIWNNFNSKMKELENKYVPKRKFNKNKAKNSFPMDEKTKTSIRKKHALSRKLIRENNDPNRREYNRIRNQVKSAVNRLKRNYERDLAKRAKKNTKEVFRYINSKAKTKVGITQLHTDPNDDKSEVTDNNKEMAEIMADYYVTVFTREPDGIIPKLDDKDIYHDMEDVIINRDKICKVINKLKVNKSPGPDGFHPRMIKELVNSIVTPIEIIFTKSTDLKIVPEQWKEAKVSAIFKKGNKKIASNYRPVSLTCIICKLLESIMRDHIIEHMRKKQIVFNKTVWFYLWKIHFPSIAQCTR